MGESKLRLAKREEMLLSCAGVQILAERVQVRGETHLGSLGYCRERALRPGVQHSTCENEYNLERALPMAASLVTTPLLVRADSGFCSSKLMQSITAQAQAARREMAFILKWNPRRTPVEAVADRKQSDRSARWAPCVRVSVNAFGRRGWTCPVLAVRLTRPCLVVARLRARRLDDHVVQPLGRSQSDCAVLRSCHA